MTVTTGQTAIITGAKGGIGLALCHAFSEAGYYVVATDRTEADVPTVGDAFVPIDLHRFCVDETARVEAITLLEEAVAGNTVKVLINNAALQIVKPVESLTLEDWQRSLNINLVAPFLLTQAFVSQLEAGKGSVINIGSIHASLTKPEFTTYATSKSALSGLTRSLAIELGKRVRVNTICPAAIATPMLLAGFEGRTAAMEELEDMHPVGHIGGPKDVAALALFLASDSACFINGAEVGLDGGIGARLHDPV